MTLDDLLRFALGFAVGVALAVLVVLAALSVSERPEAEVYEEVPEVRQSIAGQLMNEGIGSIPVPEVQEVER